MSRQDGTLALHEALDALLASRKPFACLMGAQASGKTIYSQYLERCFASNDHAWSLGRLFRAATHGLELGQPEFAGQTRIAGLSGSETAGQRVQLDTGVSRVVPQDLMAYTHAEGTKSIKHLKTAAQRKVAQGRSRNQSLGIDFIDVPGEWASGYEATGEADELRHVLDRTSVFVLFVPVWSLFPWPLVAQHLEPTADAPGLRRVLAGTSAGATALELEAAFEGAQQDTKDWVACLEDAASRRDVHVLVVLSQFQEDVVRALSRVAVAHGGADPQLDRWWGALDAVLRPATQPKGRGEAVVSALARHLSDCRGVNVDALAALADVDPDSVVLDALDRLLGFRAGLVARGAAKARKRLLSVDVMPLNVVKLSAERTLPTAASVRPGERSPPEIVDHRMCYDVLCWLLIQLHGGEIWPC